MKLAALLILIWTQFAWACPPCPSGASYSGTGATTSTAGCRCTTGTATWNGSACEAPSCTAGTLNWGAGCSGSISGVASGGSQSVTNSAAGYTGSATYPCNNGVWGAPTSSSCTAAPSGCSAVSRTWLTSCGASLPASSDAQARVVSNTNINYTGSATYTCNNGTWSAPASTSCTIKTCAGGSRPWLTNCSANVSTTNAGSSAGPISNTAVNYTGSATFACNDGTWAAPTGTSCTPQACTTQTLTWDTNCSGSATAGAHTTARALSFDDTIYFGSATATCNFGTWVISGNTCTAYCLVSGTLITMADGTFKNIEDIRVGDAVLSYDELTNKHTSNPVKEVQHHEKKSQTLFTLSLSSGKEVTSNDIHRFYLAEIGTYVSAAVLFDRYQAGLPITLLGGGDSFVVVTKIERTQAILPVYNILVSSPYDIKKSDSLYNHNYYANGVLVHNSK